MTPDTIGARRDGERQVPLPSLEALTLGGRFTVRELALPGSPGAPDVPALVCLPTSTSAPTAAILHVHGGGMIGGTMRLTVLEPLGWARELQAAVVAVDYRLAPEHPYPAGVEDCYAALSWLVAHAGELRVDPARIVIAGVSAGAGLSAAVALLARDRSGPHLAGQLLSAPMLDDRNDSTSARQLAGRGVWDQTSNDTGWTALLGQARGGPDVSPYAAPARAQDVSGLPPAFLDVGSAETFRDETVAYASRLWAAGGRAELHVWPGGFHGFSGLAPRARMSRQATAARLQWLQRLLQDPPPTDQAPGP